MQTKIFVGHGYASKETNGEKSKQQVTAETTRRWVVTAGVMSTWKVP